MNTIMRSNNLVRNVRLTEKAELMKASNKFIFDVSKDANKNELKKAIAKTHKVEVLAVNIVRTKKGKKAIVTLKPGNTINEKV